MTPSPQGPLPSRLSPDHEEAARQIVAQANPILEAIIARHLPSWVRATADIEDIRQETYLAFFCGRAGRQGLPESEAVLHLLCGMSVNIARATIRQHCRHRRDRRRGQPLLAGPQREAGFHDRQPDPAEQAAAGDYWKAALARFDERERLILEMLLCRCALRAVAATTGAPQATVRALAGQAGQLLGPWKS